MKEAQAVGMMTVYHNYLITNLVSIQKEDYLKSIFNKWFPFLTLKGHIIHKDPKEFQLPYLFN